MRNFLYFEPSSLDEATKLFAEWGAKAWKLAGGTDLLVKIKKKEIEPEVVVNLKRIPGLADTYVKDGFLHLGALITVAGLLRNSVVKQYFPALYQAAAVMGSPQIRELATVGGNICNAAPTADLVPPLVALDASVRLVSARGAREIKLEKIFRGPGRTEISAEEILTEIVVPLPGDGQRSVYLKHGIRRAHEIAIAGVAVSLSAEWTRLRHVRIALGAVAPTVVRAYSAENLLLEQPISEDTLALAASMAAQSAQPRDGVRGSAWYKREVTRVLTLRALKLCLSGGTGYGTRN
jgi:carbon-monoxide dehydrogenase medium subunit